MLVVASVGSTGSLSEFSNYGARHVHFAALGEGITAAKAGGGQWTVHGTSFAAPLVTRIAARMLLENPALSSQELRSRLIQKAKMKSALTDKIQYGILE
jgi:subtilisin family serine protease